MKNKRLNLVIGSIVGIVFLLLWLNMIDFKEFSSYFRSYKLWKTIPWLFFYILAYFFRSLRWREILKPLRTTSVSESFTIFNTGLLVNYLIPIRLGEIAKSIILKLKEKVPVSKSLPTIFLDKLTDVFPILLVIIAIPLLSMKLNSTLYIVIALIFAFFLLLLLFCYTAIYHEIKLFKILAFFLKIFPVKLRNTLSGFLEQFLKGIKIVKDPQVKLFKISIYTILAVVCESAFIFSVFKVFDTKLSFLQIMLGYTLMNLTYILPTPPAQIGSNQFMWVLIFSFGLGEDKNLTSAAVIVSHILTSVAIFASGYISMLLLNVKFLDVLSLTKARQNSSISSSQK